MLLSAIAIVLCIIVIAIIALITYARWHYGTLENMSIPVIPPKLFLGSVPDLHRKVQAEEDIQRFHTYGDIWGLYEGRTPVVFICDPDLIRQIFVKDVSHFFDRRVKHMRDDRLDEILDFLPGEKWLKLRRMQSPLFSSTKIKQYSQSLVGAAKDFVESLKNDIGENPGHRIRVETRNLMDFVSFDGIFRVGFSARLENMTDPRNQFFQALKRLMGQGQEYGWLYSLSMVFPWLSTLAPTFQLDNVIFDTYKQLLGDRRKNRANETSPVQNNSQDFADFLVDLYPQLESEEFKQMGINETTILAATLNLTALDMFSVPMSAMLYYLALNPNIQERVQAEIDEVITEKHGGEVNHDTIDECHYLIACINETLRLAPPLLRLERICNKDWVSPDGQLKIKKGTVVNVPVWATKRNPKYFPNPESFDPERFMAPSEKLSPYVFSPFGLGPRFCIGIRLALETLKINMCLVLKEFKWELRPESELRHRPGVLLLTQFQPLYLDVLRRSQD